MSGGHVTTLRPGFEAHDLALLLSKPGVALHAFFASHFDDVDLPDRPVEDLPMPDAVLVAELGARLLATSMSGGSPSCLRTVGSRRSTTL